MWITIGFEGVCVVRRKTSDTLVNVDSTKWAIRGVILVDIFETRHGYRVRMFRDALDLVNYYVLKPGDDQSLTQHPKFDQGLSLRFHGLASLFRPSLLVGITKGNGIQLLSVKPMNQQADSFFASVIELILLCLALNEVSIESGLEDR